LRLALVQLPLRLVGTAAEIIKGNIEVIRILYKELHRRGGFARLGFRDRGLIAPAQLGDFRL